MIISCNNGSYEALTTDDRIIGFKNRDEAVACAELHCGIMRLLGHEKSLKDFFPDAVEQTEKKAVFEKKTVKFRVYKGEYIVDGTSLKKKKALA